MRRAIRQYEGPDSFQDVPPMIMSAFGCTVPTTHYNPTLDLLAKLEGMVGASPASSLRSSSTPSFTPAPCCSPDFMAHGSIGFYLIGGVNQCLAAEMPNCDLPESGNHKG